MPYLPSEAAKKSKLYSNILNGAEIEYQKEIEFLKQQQSISASIDANTPLRDDEGFLVSFESEMIGVSLEEEFEQVRLENAQYFFEGEIDNEFTYYFIVFAHHPLQDLRTHLLYSFFLFLSHC